MIKQGDRASTVGKDLHAAKSDFILSIPNGPPTTNNHQE